LITLVIKIIQNEKVMNFGFVLRWNIDTSLLKL